MEEVKRTFKAIHSMISIYPRTRLYETALRHGLVRLTTLEEWGDFDQFDFKAPWMPRNSMIWCWN